MYDARPFPNYIAAAIDRATAALRHIPPAPLIPAGAVSYFSAAQLEMAAAEFKRAEAIFRHVPKHALAPIGAVQRAIFENHPMQNEET